MWVLMQAISSNSNISTLTCVSFSAGRYDPSMKPPFYAGFEAMGTVVHSSSLAVGTIVILATASGSFSEYLLVNVAAVIPIPVALHFRI